MASAFNKDQLIKLMRCWNALKIKIQSAFNYSLQTGRVSFRNFIQSPNVILLNRFKALNFKQFLDSNLEVKSDKSKGVHIVLAELPYHCKKIKHFFFIQAKLKFSEINWVKPFPVKIIEDHEFSILKTIFMLEVDSVLHFLKLSAQLVAKIKLILLAHNAKKSPNKV